MKTLMISGYKAHELGLFKSSDPAVGIIKKAIRQRLTALIEEGLEWVIVSGGLGVEQWAAEVVIQLKEEYPELQLAVITPFLNQEENWNEENQMNYETILKGADFTASVSNKPYTDPSQFRNRDDFLLGKADGLLIIYDEEKEGSPGFLIKKAKNFAEKNNLEIIRVDFQDLQWIADEEALNESEPD
ncbi:SLOG family protein [Jeotgalibacillus sp. JSM ZJ347]|uniref:SLOG family protein n=1 Tax=Jeotgalibacillus sp. JSM ZJ347 TaxID=3342117 RepID=UPI0035A90F97